MKLIDISPEGTKVYQMTEEEWRRFQAGPHGTCKGCNEPNMYCQCKKDVKKDADG